MDELGVGTILRALVPVAAGALVVLGADPALAHVEVEAAPARALATNATLSMTAEAESQTAGITGVRIQLPAGLQPADLRLAAGPGGWRLTGSGAVVTVSGPALPVGRDLALRLTVRQMPAGDRLVLKTVQTYADGTRDSWIEVPTAAVPDPDQPAPIVTLQAAAPGATPLPRAVPTRAPGPPATAAGTPGPASNTPTSAPPSSGQTPAADSTDDGGSGAGWLFGGVLVGLVLLGGVVIAARRKLR
jgi:uncharacterized protein YcnI